MPAAAVIPAPVAYIKVVAVKKLVVRTRVRGRSRGPGAAAPSSVVDFGRPFAFPALSAGVDCHVHPPRGPAGENLLLGWRPGRSKGVRIGPSGPLRSSSSRSRRRAMFRRARVFAVGRFLLQGCS